MLIYIQKFARLNLNMAPKIKTNKNQWKKRQEKYCFDYVTSKAYIENQNKPYKYDGGGR